MTRILKTLRVEGRPTVALFDTASLRNYVLKEIGVGGPRAVVAKLYTVGLGGKTITITEERLVRGEIEGLDFTMKAVAVDEIGTIDGQKVGAIIGATAMEEWEMRLDPAKGELDLSGLRRREFTDY